MQEEENKVDDFMEEEESVFRYSITSYGVDYTVDTIVNRLEKGAIFIPEFQREYVWSLRDASRFIESLILGLPVPGVFFSQEKVTNKMLVIDGQQRLKSLQYFYSKKFNGQLFKLKGVQADLEGKTIDELNESDKVKLDDCVIHATVIKQDAPTDDNSSIYMIFERLNTGGLKLVPQEIRACIYHGRFNETLVELASDENWKKIYAAENSRLKSEELVLRFLTLNETYQDYKRGFKGFLNNFMEKYQNAPEEKLSEFKSLFLRAINVVYDNLGENAFRLAKNLNAAVYDSVMVGLSYRLRNTDGIDGDKFKEKYGVLLEDTDYRKFVESNTASEVSLKGRIGKAIEAFKEI